MCASNTWRDVRAIAAGRDVRRARNQQAMAATIVAPRRSRRRRSRAAETRRCPTRSWRRLPSSSRCRSRCAIPPRPPFSSFVWHHAHGPPRPQPELHDAQRSIATTHPPPSSVAPAPTSHGRDAADDHHFVGPLVSAQFADHVCRLDVSSGASIFGRTTTFSRGHHAS